MARLSCEGRAEPLFNHCIYCMARPIWPGHSSALAMCQEPLRQQTHSSHSSRRTSALKLAVHVYKVCLRAPGTGRDWRVRKVGRLTRWEGQKGAGWHQWLTSERPTLTSGSCLNNLCARAARISSCASESKKSKGDQAAPVSAQLAGRMLCLGCSKLRAADVLLCAS